MCVNKFFIIIYNIGMKYFFFGLSYYLILNIYDRGKNKYKMVLKVGKLKVM